MIYSSWAISQNTIRPIDINNKTKDLTEEHLDGNESFKVMFNVDTSLYVLNSSEVAFDNNVDDWFPHIATKVYQMKGHDFIVFRITTTKKQAKDAAAETTEKTTAETKVFTVKFLSNAAIIGADSLHNSNLFVASFVKSIAGNSIPDNELLDLFFKMNFGKTKRFFSLMGVEAGLASVSKDSNRTPFRINEAMVSLNYAFFGAKYKARKSIESYRLKKIINDTTKSSGSDSIKFIAKNTLKIIEKGFEDKNMKFWDDTLKRTAFIGAGLKVFNAQAYIGGHIGVMEINGPLLGSYLLAGFYVTPYNTDSTLENARKAGGINTFRNNVYIEAAISAFGKNAPNFLKTIRLKFGVMLPMGKNMEGKTPNSGDVLSRLAVEVPLGGVFKF